MGDRYRYVEWNGGRRHEQQFFDGGWHDVPSDRNISSKRDKDLKKMKNVHENMEKALPGSGAKSGVAVHKTEAAVCAAQVAGVKLLSADANTQALHASASARVTPLTARAGAKAGVAAAGASAALVEGFIEASAKASVLEASAQAGFGPLGAHASAEACVAKVEAGISNTPLQAHAKGPGAEAETGVSWNYTGASVGAHAGEVKVGPFAVRAGLKFGIGIRNGVPEVDLGPITI